MFFEQYNHEPNIATLRFWLAFVGENALSDMQKAQIPGKRAAGDAALALMDAQLGRTPFLVGDALTLADIALYAYTHVAGEGGFDLQSYRAVTAWMARIAAMPGHIGILD